MVKAVKYETEFVKKQKESKDAYTFYFQRPKEFEFTPGQYLKLFLEIPNPDNRGSSRYFTISSSPKKLEYLTITTRIIKSSFKLKLDSLNPGDRIIAFGPIGYFDFFPEKQKKVVFIAGGIGVTPFHSILKTFDLNKLRTNFILFNSFDFKENIIFYDEFKKIEKENPNSTIIYTLTKDKNNYSDFEKGRIDENLLRKNIDKMNECNYFITGPEVMVNSIYELLKKMKVPEEKIFKEDFPGY